MVKYEIDFRTLNIDKLNKAMSKVGEIDKKFETLTNNISQSRRELNGLSDFKVIRFFDSLEDKFISLARHETILQEAGGNFGLMKNKAMEYFTLLNGGGAFSMKKMGKSLLIVGKSLFNHAALYSGVAIASTIAFKIWGENIGNVQGLWIKFVGNLKNIWAKGDVALRRKLRTFGDVLGAIFKRIFALAEGFVQGFLDGTAKMLEFFEPLEKGLRKVFKLMGGGGDDSIDTWKRVGEAIGAIMPAILGLFILVKIIAIIKAVVGAVWLLNAAMTANPIGAIIVGVALLAAGMIFLEKKFGVFTKALEGWAIAFKFIFKMIVLNIKLMLAPLLLAMKAYKTVKGWVSRDKGNEAEMSGETKKSILQTSGSSQVTNDNRTASVVVHTQQLDSRNARNIAGGFLDPTMQANKNI